MSIAAISADSHVTEPANSFLDFIDPKFRDRAPRMEFIEPMGDCMVVDGKIPVPLWLVAGAGRPADTLGFTGSHRFEELWPGGWDPAARLLEQDQDGVIAEVIYPSVGMVICNLPDVAYKRACMDAYNQWISQFCAHAPNRLIGMGQTAVRGVDETIADVEAIKALGLRGVMLPGRPATDFDYDDPRFDPLWQALIDLKMPPSFHILTGNDNSLSGAVGRGPRINQFLAVIRANQDIMGMLIFGGVFERNPALRVVCVEADAGWVPHYAYRMDHAYDRHRNWLPSETLTKKPSEYFFEHVYVTFQDDFTAFRVAEAAMMPVSQLLWANDHPNSDATWPWSQDILAKHTVGLTEAQINAIVRDNTATLYDIAI